IALAHLLKKIMRWTARAHVVLGMHLEPADIRPALDHIAIVLRLEPGAGAARNPRLDTPGPRAVHRRHRAPQPLIGASEPLRFMPFLSVTSIDMQVPLATYFQAPRS